MCVILDRPTSRDRIAIQAPTSPKVHKTGRWHVKRPGGVWFFMEEGRRVNMCFCETNRIYLGVKTGDKILRWNRMRSKRVGISIRFVWRENDIAVCHGSTESGVSSDSAPSDSAPRLPKAVGLERKRHRGASSDAITGIRRR